MRRHHIQNVSYNLKTEIMHLRILSFFLLFSLDLFSQNIARVETIKINSSELNQEREILVYTPQLYEESSLTSFDVIYVFDAQNREMFDYAQSTISFLEEYLWKKFIVVGITSPYIEENDYSRNNDMLPVLHYEESIEAYGQYSGNTANFLKYVKNEVIPYIESNYRTLNKKVAIGHSLSASFILSSLTKEPELFTDYIAISPNLAYDRDRVANELINFDYKKIKNETFLYISHANEASIKRWKSWKPAREKVYHFLEDSLDSPKLHTVIKEFPNEGHLGTFHPSYKVGITEYLKYFSTNYESFLSKETYKIKVTVQVPNKNDQVYLTGNQEILSNWNEPNKIQFNKKSDYLREVKLTVQSPVEFKLTRGSWDTEAWIKGNDAFRNISISLKENLELNYEVINWDDKIE